MPYDEARFIGRQNQALSVAVSTGTFTASDHVITATTAQRVPIARACKLLGGSAVVTTAGVSASPQFVIMQSTNTGVVIGPSHSLGAAAVGTLSGTRSFTAGEVGTVNIIHTGTASATQITPVAELILDLQDQFA